MNQLFERWLDPMSAALDRRTPLVFARGNHEMRGPFARALFDSAPLSTGEYYDAFDHGPIPFVVLDSGEDNDDDTSVYARRILVLGQDQLARVDATSGELRVTVVDKDGNAVDVLQDEPERRSFNQAIEQAETRRMSVATFVEVSMVLETRHGAEGLRDLDVFIDRAGIELVAVDAEQGMMARRAFSRFGRGPHAAGLNFGDCFSYALAAVVGEPLLFKGTDFGQTDVPTAV